MTLCMSSCIRGPCRISMDAYVQRQASGISIQCGTLHVRQTRARRLCSPERFDVQKRPGGEGKLSNGRWELQHAQYVLSSQGRHLERVPPHGLLA